MNLADEKRLNRLEQILDEAKFAERAQAAPEAAPFLSALHARLAREQPPGAGSTTSRSVKLRWLWVAGLAALFLASALLLQQFPREQTPAREEISAADCEVDAILSLLEESAALESPASESTALQEQALEDLDEETLEILDYWDLLQDPEIVELLENS